MFGYLTAQLSITKPYFPHLQGELEMSRATSDLVVEFSRVNLPDTVEMGAPGNVELTVTNEGEKRARRNYSQPNLILGRYYSKSG